MIYVTGDMHGDLMRYVYFNNDTENSPLTDKDYLIVCGDYGFVFYTRGSMGYLVQQEHLDEVETKLPYTTLWVDGNHENFDLLDTYPVEEWNGGKVHRIRKNILHLIRGQVYDIDGVKVFAMGGAYSIDKCMRREGYSWWHQELPNNEEYKEAAKNLEAAGYKVDIIATHTAPREVIYRMGETPDAHDMELTGFLDWIMHEVEFKKWYFGHWHRDGDVTHNIRAVYEDAVKHEE